MSCTAVVIRTRGRPTGGCMGSEESTEVPDEKRSDTNYTGNSRRSRRSRPPLIPAFRERFIDRHFVWRAIRDKGGCSG